MHNIFTEEATKIALSSNDDKRLQNFGGIASYPFGINAGKLCKAELLKDINIKWLTLIMLRIKMYLSKSDLPIYSRSSI